jgi:endonuclease/exonuclease/phosphatase (EEP) superfamily protein YafD
VDGAGAVTRAARLAVAAAGLAVAGFVGAVAASFLPLHPCSLIEHFRLQLALGGAAVVAAAGALALGAGWLDARWFDAALVALLVDACVIVPDLASAPRAVGDGAPVRVLVVNVLRSSEHFEAVRRLIADEQPDLVALVETDPGWLRELAPALAAYPARIEAPRDDNFGMALYARGSLVGAVEHLEVRVPAIVAEASIGGVRLAVALVHPVPPLDGALYDDQLRHFDAIAARVRGAAAPFLIMGDFNATPWSRAFARLRGDTGACDTRAGRGAQTSFPADGWLLRIPIDHILAACSIGVRDRRIGPDVGSDHLPVIADLIVPR